MMGLRLAPGSGVIDPVGLRRLLREYLADGGCTHGVQEACACQLGPVSLPELLSWLTGSIEPPPSMPRGNSTTDHLSEDGRARVVAGQRRRWDRVRQERAG